MNFGHRPGLQLSAFFLAVTLLCTRAFGGSAIRFTGASRCGCRLDGKACPFRLTGARLGCGDLRLKPLPFLVTRPLGGLRRELHEPGTLLFPGVLDRGGGLGCQVRPLFLAGAHGSHGRLRFEAGPFFLPRLLGGVCGGRLEAGAFLFTGALGSGGGSSGQVRAFLFAGARFDGGSLRLEPEPFLLAGSLRGGGRCGNESRAFLLAGVLGGGCGLRREAYPFLLTCPCRSRGAFRLHAAPFLVSRLLGGFGSRLFEMRALFLAGRFHSGGHGRFRGDPCPLLLPGPGGGLGSFSPKPPQLLVLFAFRHLRLCLRFLPAERLEHGTLGCGLGFRSQPFGLQTVRFRFTAELLRAAFGL